MSIIERPARKSSPSTLHQQARAAEQAKRSREIRAKKRVALPVWFDPAVSFLKTLNLSTPQLAAVTEHLGLHRSTLHIPVLVTLDAMRLQRIIDGVTPDASTDDTPHPDDAVIASDDDWAAFRALFDSSPGDSLRHAVTSVHDWTPSRVRRPVGNFGWSDADQARHGAC